MAQHLPIGKPPAQHLVHRRYIEQALAGKSTLPEYILIHLGASSAVSINTELPGKQPVIKGARMFPRQRCRHPGLQHAVALHDGAGRRVKDRLVAGVGRDTHQRAESSGRQLGVSVQRDHIGRTGHDVAQGAQIDKITLAAPCQSGDQGLQLAALALPTDPGVFRPAETPLPVQQRKARGRKCLPRCSVCRGGYWVALVQGLEGAHRMGQQHRVGGRGWGGSVQMVGQQHKLGQRLRIGQVVQMEPAGQGLNARRIHQHARDHHRHPVLGG